MAIDLKTEMAKIVVAYGDTIARYRAPEELLELVVRKGDMNDFREYFSRYALGGRRWKGLASGVCESIFGPRWMARFETPHLKWIYHMLTAEDSRLKYTARIVADRRIAAERRALCFHAVFDADTHSNLSMGIITILPHFWWYNRCAWNAYINAVGKNDDDAFIRRLGCCERAGFRVSEAMREGAVYDSVAVFEMNREFENRKISDSLMQFLLHCNAAKCFVYLLANHGERVFKLRSPQEWLLTVCRCAEEELAVAAVNELERQFPGIVAGTHDSWGGNPLWCTFCKLGPKEKLRAELIRLGCDPEEENEFGISYRLLRENDPQNIH